MIYDKIFKYVEHKKFFDKHDKVLIAVSGGVDSMNLLHFLHAYQKQLNIKIGLAHINHKQRLQSDEEETYLKNWAEKKQLPFYSDTYKGPFSEKKARDFRYAFFKKIMFKYGYTALVTAHHADDQAETIFLRLLRGSRLRYLTGIKEVQPFACGQLIRPFLTFSKKDLPYIFHFDDSSNKESRYLRNRIRNTYLPTLKQENPQIARHLIDLGAETDKLFQAFADLSKQLDPQDCQVFQNQSESVQYFLLQGYLEKFPDLNISKKQFNDLLHILRTKNYYHHYLKNGYYLKKDDKMFEIAKIGLKTDGDDEQRVLECDSMVKYGQYIFSFQKESDSKEGFPLKSDAPILIRKRRPGDKIQLGSYSKKVRRLFIDEKIPPAKRSEAVIIEQAGEIILILLDDVTYLRKDFKDGIMKGRLYIQNRNW
ncbi:tRNA lysidine(34) synthetase TilS [Streptococcus ratti]|uniref:tRNA(Ile)-lysidine synthase n=1 Tax=Streptococcus ratti TaxID=1341 RepID=A0A7X9LEL8_STRRT|nr:tRNA lysidine(34) synthetase TilS [Streptococcus ratti]NMD49851.1 tRNA lysidine(34) synthetase TilS [Streptococcus ratti]